MLKGLRKNTKLIIWIIILSFVLWGAFSVGIQFQQEGQSAGEVFGRSVSFQEYDRFYKAVQIFSFAAKPSEDPDVLRQEAWQNILYAREARRLKIKVSDDEVRAEIMKLLERQNLGNPTPAQYRQWLQATVREKPQEFEAQVRNILLIQKLIHQVQSSQPVEPASEEQAHKLFLLRDQDFSAEMAKFPNQTEALAFYEKMQKPEAWKKDPTKPAENITQVEKTNLQGWMRLQGLTEENVLALHRLEKNSVSKPLPVAGGFGVFHILDKSSLPEEKFQKELKTTYIQELSERKKYENFLKWHWDLMNRAKLKDFLPKPEPETPLPNA